MSNERIADELLSRLSVLIGMIMEDEVDAAVSRLPSEPVRVADHFTALQQAGQDIAALAAAADIVMRRYR